jgi:hypothetical protein
MGNGEQHGGRGPNATGGGRAGGARRGGLRQRYGTARGSRRGGLRQRRTTHGAGGLAAALRERVKGRMEYFFLGPLDCG